MVKLLRIVLLFVIAVLLVEAVIAVASGTGILEKALIAGVAAALVFVALPRVRRLGTPHPR